MRILINELGLERGEEALDGRVVELSLMKHFKVSICPLIVTYLTVWLKAEVSGSTLTTRVKS
jgi:hypothetical protein